MMEQQQFRVKFSLSTKLVLSLSLLFIVVVGFLATSAIRLVIEDKKAYTYQVQSMEAYVASRDFSEKVRLALDNLRLYLTSFDPRQPITPAQRDLLSSLVNSQQETVAMTAYLVKSDGTANYLAGQIAPESVKRLRLDPATEFFLPSGFFKSALSQLQKQTFAFGVHRISGLPPLLGIMFADVSLKDFEGGMPVAIAWVDLSRLQISKRFGDVRIANVDGKLLYSSIPAEMVTDTNFGDHLLYQVAQSAAPTVQGGAREYELDKGKYLGTWQRTSFGAIVTTQLPMAKAMEAAIRLGEQLILLGVCSLIAAILFAVFFANSITKPLKSLFRATAAVAQGDFNVDPKVTTRDEVGQLANSFVSMSKKIQTLLTETKKNAHIEEELKVAAAVQESLIPAPEYRDDRMEIIGHYQSATECGGDWWGFFRLGDKICIMIADATGHGVPSALITASARSCLSVIHKLARERPDTFLLKPGELMAYANKVIFDAATTKIMMTFFIGVIDLEARRITYANAGHNPPWLFLKFGDGFKLRSLMPKGNRLGEVEESGNYEETSVPMDVGDILFLYTDGLLENKNLAGEMYGKKRSRAEIEASLEGGPSAVIDNIVKAYRKFNESKPLDDDVTLAAVRIIS